MAYPLRQSTASQEVPLGHFLDSSDGDSAMTALTIANTDIKLHKTGATSLADKNSGGATHMAGAVYYAVMDATDTNTIGPLVIYVHVAGALAVKVECVVLDEAVFDVMFGTTAPSTYAGGDTSGTTTLLTRVVGTLASGTHNPQGGDAYTRIGAAGASLSSIPWNALWDAEVQSEAEDALTVYSPPTKAEMNARTLVAADYFDAATDIVARVTLVDTTTANTDMRGTNSAYTGTPPTVAQITADMDANSTQLAAIVEDTGTTLPGTLATIAGYVDTEVAAILAAVDTEVAAIKAKTDNLPASPAAVGSAMTLAADQAVNATKIGGTTQTGRDLGASVLISSGTGTGQLDVTSGVIKANLAQILGTALTETGGYIAAAFKQFFNVASPTGTMKAITAVTTVTTTTNLTNLPAAAATATELAKVPKSDAAVSWNATALGAITTAATASTPTAAAVTGNVGGNVVGSVGSLAAQAKADVNAEVDAALNTAIPGSPTADSINERIVAIDAFGAPPSVAAITADMDANSTKLAAIVADTNELQGNQGDWATADVSGLATPTNITAGTITTVTNLTNLPAAAATAAELAKVPKSDAAVSWNATALAAINAQADLALTDYDPPTKAELDSAVAPLALQASVDDLEGRLTATRAGYLDNLTRLVGTLATGTHQPQSGDAYAAVGALNDFDPATDIVAHVTLVDTTTVNTDMVSEAPTLAQFVTVDTGETSAAAGSVAKIAQGAAGGGLSADDILEGAVTVGDALRLLLAVMAGKSAGGGTYELAFRDQADGKDRVAVTVDASGNRTAVVVDGTL